MGRRLSWLDRLYPISRTVAGSARSHYDRKDLQQLFEIQPRSAQNLMAALPTVPIGRARLVDRETLSNFLEQLQQADDPAQAFAEIREGKGRDRPAKAAHARTPRCANGHRHPAGVHSAFPRRAARHFQDSRSTGRGTDALGRSSGQTARRIHHPVRATFRTKPRRAGRTRSRPSRCRVFQELGTLV